MAPHRGDEDDDERLRRNARARLGAAAVIPFFVVSYALLLPWLGLASAEACAITTLFFSTSLALSSFIDEEALHALFFPAVEGSGMGLPLKLRMCHWLLGNAILYALLRICDGQDTSMETMTLELYVLLIALTYMDFIFSMTSAKHRQAQGQQPDISLYVIAAVPAATYAVMISLIMIQLNMSYLPLVVATRDPLVLLAMPLVHAVCLIPCMPRILRYFPWGSSSDRNGRPAAGGGMCHVWLIYVAMSLWSWQRAPPLRLAMLLSKAPTQMLTRTRSMAISTRALGCAVAIIAAIVALGAVWLFIGTFLQGMRRTLGFLRALSRSGPHWQRISLTSQQQKQQAVCDDEEARIGAYSDLATEFYQWGWGNCFHFADKRSDESHNEALLRHEYYLAGLLQVSADAHILDCGCGVGGAARNIARFSGCQVTGVAVSGFQVGRANALSAEENMREKVEFLEAPGLAKLPFLDNSFDAVYAIESTCHSPDRCATYAEIMRVLKPGGVFACYEWCLTDRYDASSEEHRRIKRYIEIGFSLPEILPASACLRLLQQPGFDVLEARDCARDQNEGGEPWHLRLQPSWNPLVWPGFQFNPVVFRLLPWVLRLGESLGVLPVGTVRTQMMLQAAAEGLLRGGALGIISPMFLVVTRKPAGSP
eukprot:TRINITY_DN5678_c2_g1_i1.p1 TRINITY_DN5678_c2_g1~~TRINITY_DN5678_c2_g1_i1.p1  ORF type:complete len:670 (+),score=144.23 TRINITY_DN5678_c2_g1_i1:56-2011(+)